LDIKFDTIPVDNTGIHRSSGEAMYVLSLCLHK